MNKNIITVKGLARALKNGDKNLFKRTMSSKYRAEEIWEKDKDFIKDPQWKKFSQEEIEEIIVGTAKDQKTGIKLKKVNYDKFKELIQKAHRDPKTSHVKVDKEGLKKHKKDIPTLPPRTQNFVCQFEEEELKTINRTLSENIDTLVRKINRVKNEADERYAREIISLREERDKYQHKYMMIKKHYKQLLRILEETEI